MATQRLAPTSLKASSGLLAPLLLALTDDVLNPGLTWLVALSNNTAVTTRVGFPAPLSNLQTGAGLQQFRVLLRKTPLSGTGTPTVRLELWSNGQLITAGTNTNVTSMTGQLITLTWNSSQVASSATVECNIVATASGGTIAQRAAVDIGAVEWLAAITQAPSELVAEVLADTGLEPLERSKRAAKIKADALSAAAPSFTAIGALEITLTSLPVVDEFGRLSVTVAVTRGGAPVVFPPHTQPFIFVNPPLVHQGIEDPLAAFRQMLTDTVNGYG